MAEDNLTEIMKDWDTTDIGELGSSLLARKTSMDKAAAKRAKRADRTAKIMAGVMGMQALYNNVASRRIKENEQNNVFSKALTVGQLPALQEMAGVYQTIEEQEKILGTAITKDNIADLYNTNQDFANIMYTTYAPRIDQFFTRLGQKDASALEKEEYADMFLPSQLIEMMGYKDKFKMTVPTLFGEGELTADDIQGRDFNSIYKRIIQLDEGRLDSLKAKNMLAMNRDILDQSKGILRFDNLRGALSQITFGLVPSKEDDPLWGTKETGRLAPWEATMEQIGYANGLNNNMKEIYAPAAGRNYWAKGLRDTTTIEWAMGKEGDGGMIANLAMLERSGQIDTGLGARGTFLEGNHRSQLRRLSIELADDKNFEQREAIAIGTAAVYQYMKDDQNFRIVMMDGKDIKDDAKLRRAALSFTIRETVSPKSERIHRKRIVFGPRFDYKIDKVKRVLEKSFKIEDNQFKTTKVFNSLPQEEQLERLNIEFKRILDLRDFSDEQKRILTETLVLNTEGANIFNNIYPTVGLTDAELIDLFNGYDTIGDMVDALPELFTLKRRYNLKKPPSERVVKMGPLGILRSRYPRGVPEVFRSPMPTAFEDDED